jgi:hypothetical protein
MSELKFKKLRLLHAARLRRLHFWLSSHWGTLLPSTVCPASQNYRPAEYCDTFTCIIATDHFNMVLFDVRMYMEKCIPGTRAVPWLRRLVAGLSPRRPVFAPKSVHVGFVVDKVALGQGFLRVLRFSPVSIVPSWLFIGRLICHLGDEQ